MGLRFKNGANESEYINLLQQAAKLNSDKFDAYTHETMPERYHFAHNPRISPIYLVPKLGYALTRTRETGATFVKGNHGYDNEYPEMQAIFVADGPFTQRVKQSLMASHDKALHYQTPTVIEGFANVELKGLIGKLLGVNIDPHSHNGTAGFWDKYLN